MTKIKPEEFLEKIEKGDKLSFDIELEKGEFKGSIDNILEGTSFHINKKEYRFNDIELGISNNYLKEKIEDLSNLLVILKDFLKNQQKNTYDMVITNIDSNIISSSTMKVIKTISGIFANIWQILNFEKPTKSSEDLYNYLIQFKIINRFKKELEEYKDLVNDKNNGKFDLKEFNDITKNCISTLKNISDSLLNYMKSYSELFINKN